MRRLHVGSSLFVLGKVATKTDRLPLVRGRDGKSGMRDGLELRIAGTSGCEGLIFPSGEIGERPGPWWKFQFLLLLEASS